MKSILLAWQRILYLGWVLGSSIKPTKRKWARCAGTHADMHTPRCSACVSGSWGGTCWRGGRGWRTWCWGGAAGCSLWGTTDRSVDRRRTRRIECDVLFHTWVFCFFSNLERPSELTTVRYCSICPSTLPSLNWSLYCGRPMSSSHPSDRKEKYG